MEAFIRKTYITFENLLTDFVAVDNFRKIDNGEMYGVATLDLNKKQQCEENTTLM